MSNYSISSINSLNSINSNYINNSRSSNSSNISFNEVLGTVANVPMGNKSQYSRSYSTQNCAIHSSNSNNYNNFNINASVIENSTETSTRSAQTQKAIEIAKSYLGGKYVWGATGPNAFDCSGFTQYIYKQAYGKSIPRVSYDQANYGEKVSKENLQPGDLVFFDTMNKGRVSHVGIYIGDNKFIHAASSKSGIIESELSGYYSRNYLGARRP